jgi:predicted kinase
MSWALWITGFPGSGKSVIARAAGERLRAMGEDVTILELDVLRRALTPTATYGDEEREAVYRALVYIGVRLVESGRSVIFDATAHRRAWRDLARAALPRFAEVQLVCPLEVCRQREQSRPRGAAPPGIYGRWPEEAPFDAIVATAGGPYVPPSLLRQLAIGGRLLMPVGPPHSQEFIRVTRPSPDVCEREVLEKVAFVPFIGAEGWQAGEVGA